MKKNTKSTAQLAKSIRKTWSVSPVTRVIKSKKAYCRADKSWKKEL